MGAEVPIWVEIEVKQKLWVMTSAVTEAQAFMDVSSACSNRLTGRASYTRPVYPERVDDFFLDRGESCGAATAGGE